jgi:single-stranded DNA-binding protein
MSDINAKNYDGSTVVLVGRAGGPVEVKEFRNGSQAQLSIAVSKGYKKGDQWVDTGTDWYTLTATEDYARQNWPNVQKGDKVRVDEARLEFHPYNKNNGDAAVDATLRYGTLVVVESAKPKDSGVAPF